MEGLEKNLKPTGQSSKYWLRLRNEREKPKTGITNTLRILTAKWKLKYHRAAQSVLVAETIMNDPNKLWKTRSANEEKIKNNYNISELQWFSYFMRLFAEPDAKKG